MAFANSQHTVKRFDAEIQQIVNLVLEMGQTVERQVSRACEVFRTVDAEAAREVIAGDHAVNRWDMEIDRSCVRLLSRRQPMSTDLRLVMSLNKAVNDLERIGDEAKTIAERTLSIHERGVRLPGGLPEEVDQLAAIASQRIKLALDCLVRLDVEQSWTLVRTDKADDVFQAILRALSASVLDGELAVATIIDMAIALKALKRVAERAQNLAEYVIYIIEGQDVRHNIG
ncbi:MAG: phosphate signaling complex protein PhoU [Candidatus Competibacteraceae bacterium]|jgi:phosphate transport system protein|nr:phosphate signaling complex protein PhoU [Candidatus Competibacteraceae bacterium]MBK7984499.1 phosphate signaling complex protein PhoU [Candidatus Competibacteraceae bacterium]MBK8897240.1 phosphate signaling complex protein PhoU [Candidatus Competibacteraceae bacterium]MBK8964728.1 phosphate signaling complex protein PhoU [Candidatus Competibacteraceae bacterium]MBK9950004.1 phosphate signaling complex protein PhoU [Candidatus Competibacteraceae bacterium]